MTQAALAKLENGKLQAIIRIICSDMYLVQPSLRSFGFFSETASEASTDISCRFTATFSPDPAFRSPRTRYAVQPSFPAGLPGGSVACTINI